MVEVDESSPAADDLEHAKGITHAPPSENASELLAAALDGQITDEELDAVDDALDSMMLGEASAKSLGKSKPLISVEDAQEKLSPEILKVLADKFKGSPTQVRHKDERDQIF